MFLETAADAAPKIQQPWNSTPKASASARTCFNRSPTCCASTSSARATACATIRRGPKYVQDLVRRRDFGELQQALEHLHPADVAYILEALPLDERLIVWDLVKAERDGEILLEVSDAVRETLIAQHGRARARRGDRAARHRRDRRSRARICRARSSRTSSSRCRSKSASSCAPRCRTTRTRSARSWISTWSKCART